MNRRDVLGLGAGAVALALARSQAKGADMPRTKKALSFARDIPVLEPRDVVVCGGGPSGVAAAMAAQRAGLNVLLVEAQGQLGGMGVSGMVSHWLGGRTSAPSKV